MVEDVLTLHHRILVRPKRCESMLDKVLERLHCLFAGDRPGKRPRVSEVIRPGRVYLGSGLLSEMVWLETGG